jgi:hypothetical protein
VIEDSAIPKIAANHVGNAGEHYVMACLLSRGHHAALTDRNNPHFDIIVRTQSGKFFAVRVKTCSGDSFQWTAKSDDNPLPGFDPSHADSDLTALVAFRDAQPGKETEVYLMPTAKLIEEINRSTSHYWKFPKRDGSERKRTSQRVLRLGGKPREDNLGYGFRERWKKFRDAWHLLK